MDLISEHICNEVALPLCSIVGCTTTKYISSTKEVIPSVFIRAPYTIALLIITVLCAIRMILHVNSLFSSIGRGEMRVFFYFYISANSLLCFLIIFKRVLPNETYKFLSIIHSGTNATFYFSSFMSSLTIHHVYGIFRMSSNIFMITLCSIYFILSTTFIFMCVAVKNRAIITFLECLNCAFILMYFILQAKKLKSSNSDIWPYGVLFVIFLFYTMSKVHQFVGAKLIALLSEKNLDNLFFVIFYTFLVVMMIHKYWLNTCDFELECMALIG